MQILFLKTIHCFDVAVTILEEYCMAYADLQCLFYSGERIVTLGPRVIKSHSL